MSVSLIEQGSEPQSFWSHFEETKIAKVKTDEEPFFESSQSFEEEGTISPPVEDVDVSSCHKATSLNLSKLASIFFLTSAFASVLYLLTRKREKKENRV